MFKKLRNRLLIVNTLIIAALVLGSFSVIYLMTAQNAEREINLRLERAIESVRNDHMPKPDDRRPQSRGEHMPENPPPMRDIPMFSMTFTVVTDSNSNVEKVNIPFELDEDFYSSQLEKIISSKNNSGSIKTDNGRWNYKVLPLESGFAIAFTETYAEYTILRNLILILLFVGLLALTAAFLISLFSANRSIRPVEESYNKQKQFIADASHELKTPLTTINTNVDVLLSHPESSIESEKKWLHYIKNEAERMTKLTNDLLYLARVDYSDSKVIFDRVSFSQSAESVILLMEAVVFEKDVTLSYDIEPDRYVYGCAEQLKQLIMILLDNAVKYTPKKGEINLKLSREASDIVLRVRNTGEGISSDAQKQIFERFYRADKSRARESGGYGLGLAIAKAIVESCKGTIRVDSQKNEYTEFTVRIPSAK